MARVEEEEARVEVGAIDAAAGVEVIVYLQHRGFVVFICVAIEQARPEAGDKFSEVEVVGLGLEIFKEALGVCGGFVTTES